MKIFNWRQADIFVKHNAKVIGIGLGDRNKMYVEFAENDAFKELIEKWLKKEI